MRRIALLIIVFAAKASAHHSAAAHFDLDKTITLNATISKFEFVNPHGYVYFTVPGPNGTETPWRCELEAKVALVRHGWTQDTFQPGHHVVIKGAPARREENVCYLNSFIGEDGREIGRMDNIGHPNSSVTSASRPARLPDGHPNLQGLWVAQFGPGRGRGRGRGPGREGRGPGPEGRGPGGPPGIPEPTSAGLLAARGYQQPFDDPGLKCSPANILFGWTHDQHVNEIVQNKDTIVLKYGYMDLVRTIYMNGTHPKTIAPSLGGHSTGRWEGDTLVVDTVGFKPGVLNPMSGLQHSGSMHVTERFTLDTAASALKREFYAEDPLYWNTAYTGSDVMLLSAEPWAPYACKELSGKNNQRPGYSESH